MRKQDDILALSPDFAIYLLGLEQKYRTSLDEILEAVARFGYNKGKIRGYLELHSFMKKNNLPAENIHSMINRWFPA